MTEHPLTPFRRSLRPGRARLPRVPGENFLRLTLWGFPPATTLPSKEECRKHSQNRKRPLQPSCPAAGRIPFDAQSLKASSRALLEQSLTIGSLTRAPQRYTNRIERTNS